MHKKSTLLTVSIFFVLFMGLSDYGYGHHRDGHNKGGDDGGDGGGSGKSIPLIVTFRDCNGGMTPVGAPPELAICDDDSTDAIQSDLWGPYANKEDRVVAAINKSGTFRLGVAGNSPPPIRKLFYDFSNCASKIGDPPCLPPDPMLFPLGLSIGAVNWYTSGVNLREVPVHPTDEVMGGLSAELNLNNNDGGNWRILFDFNPSDLDCPDSLPVTVTHPDTDTWVIEADKDAVACLKLLDPGGVGTGEPMGLFHMTFQIMLKKK